MDGYRGILDTGQVEGQKMINEKLIDGRELQVDLKVN